MNYLNINDIKTIQEEKNKNKTVAFEHILSQCFTRIKKQASMFPTNTFCFYDVPEFILGYPLYKMEDCIKYLMAHIENNGFNVKYIFPRVLIISWSPLPSIEYQPPKMVQKPSPPPPKRGARKKETTGKFILNLD
jgi:hypothetical protein